MPKVKMVKQWRGHDPGTEPDLTEERAAELIREGYAEPYGQPEPVAAEPVEEPEPEPVSESPKPRRRRSRNRGNDSTDS